MPPQIIISALQIQHPLSRGSHPTFPLPTARATARRTHATTPPPPPHTRDRVAATGRLAWRGPAGESTCTTRAAALLHPVSASCTPPALLLLPPCRLRRRSQMAAPGFFGGALPPRPTAATKRRSFVAPHRQSASIPLTANLPRRQEGPSLGSGSDMMPSPGSGGSGLPCRFPNDQPLLGPRALTFTEPHATTWDAGSTTTSPTHSMRLPATTSAPTIGRLTTR
jgi:hypothetical protein